MDVEGDRFRRGMRVLVVDDNLPCLRILEKLLMKCNYHVTIASQATMALKMLREKKDKFDIVISDVHMPEMDGFKLLELIGHELDVPVLMLSTSDDLELVMKGVTHGAVDYLLKPVRLEELKNIWQHVVRKNKCSPNVSDSEAVEDGTTVHALVDGNGNSHPTTLKPQVVWTVELHKMFVDAVDQLGLDKAFPKKILDIMNVEGLTVENVASHLEKYRIYQNMMMSSESRQPLDSSIYPNIGKPSSHVIPPWQYHIGPGGMLNRTNTAAAYRTASGGMQDYMENWQPGNVSPSTAHQHQMNCNQLPCSGFRTGFPSADISQIQSAFKRSFADGSPNLSSPNEDLKGSQGSFISYNYIDIYLFFMFYLIILMFYLFIM